MEAGNEAIIATSAVGLTCQDMDQFTSRGLDIKQGESDIKVNVTPSVCLLPFMMVKCLSVAACVYLTPGFVLGDVM